MLLVLKLLELPKSFLTEVVLFITVESSHFPRALGKVVWNFNDLYYNGGAPCLILSVPKVLLLRN